LNAGAERDYTIAMVNDEDRPRAGTLRLVFMDADGKEATVHEEPFSLAPLGAQSYTVTLKTPAVSGKYSLRAIAVPEDNSAHPTISRRDVLVEAVAANK
jgi:uncharacterized protein YfaS (alpha-2-macroglobulin family)